MPLINLLGSFQDPLNLDEGGGVLVNVRVVPRQQQEGKQALVRLVGAPGLPQVCKPSSSPCIALSSALGSLWSGHADGSIWYGVETPTPVLAGFVAVDPVQPVIRFAQDRTALAIASNRNTDSPLMFGTAYTATQGGGVVNAGFNASINFDPSAVAELNNVTIWSGASNFYANQSDRMYSSIPLAPATVPPNNFATAEARPDRVVDLAVSGQVMWPLGALSCEQWYAPGGTTDFAFTSFPNSLLEVGIAARLTLAQIRSLIVFVGTDKRVWVCKGQTGQPASPAWVDLLLQQLTQAELLQLTAYAYGQGGSDFYVLTLPGKWSLELSASTGVWSYRVSPGGRLDHAGRCAAEQAGGVTYVGLDTGEICLLDLNSSSEPAGTLLRTMVTPYVGSQESRQQFNALDVTSSMGPQAGDFLFDWSDTNDVTVGGVLVTPRTWRGARSIQLPQPGVRRAIARELGSGRRRQFRFRYEGTQAPFTFDEMFLHATSGS